MVFYYQMIYFPETDNTIKHDSCYGCRCSNYCTMHNDTHSEHKRRLVLWRARLLCSEASRYVYPPPLSDANCPPFPPPGGPGPPAPKMAPISPGSTHTPSTPFVTRLIPSDDCFLNFVTFICVRYHCGGWPEEVNSCVLNSYMVYL